MASGFPRLKLLWRSASSELPEDHTRARDPRSSHGSLASQLNRWKAWNGLKWPEVASRPMHTHRWEWLNLEQFSGSLSPSTVISSFHAPLAKCYFHNSASNRGSLENIIAGKGKRSEWNGGYVLDVLGTLQTDPTTRTDFGLVGKEHFETRWFGCALAGVSSKAWSPKGTTGLIYVVCS